MTVAAVVTLGTGTTPATPGTGMVSIYPKTDRKYYILDDTNTETQLALGGVVGPANTVFLAVGGVDGSAARGDASKPFGSFKAALQACQNGDVLKIGAGVFTLAAPADIPAWPAGLHRLVIDGSGCDLVGTAGTVIQNTANDGSHIIAPPSHVTSLLIRNLRAQVTAGTGRALYCDGAGSGGAYLGGGLAGGLIISNCAFFGASASARFKDIGVCSLDNVFFEIGGNTITEFMSCAFVSARGTSFGKTLFSYDTTDVDRPAFTAETDFTGCAWTDDFKVSGGGTGLKVAFFDCSLHNVNANALVDTVSIKMYGGFCESFDFQGQPMADVAGNKIQIFNAHINTSLKFKIAGAAVNTIIVEARQCDVRNIGAINILADVGITLDLRGSNTWLSGAQFVTNGTGKIRPSTVIRTHTTDGATPDIITPDQGGSVAFAAAPDYCMVSCKGGVGAGIVSATPTSPTQVTIDYGGGAGDITVASYWG